MKNVQVIDSALNCAYDVFSAHDDDFAAIFPAPGQDIEFIGDFINRVGEAKADEICGRLWGARADKKSVCGIHGTLFYELDHKKIYYPTKRESEMITAIG